MTTKQIEVLKGFGDLQENVSLSKLTTLKIGGDVKALLYPNNMLGLLAAVKLCKKEGIPYKVLGHGSNILASDDDYDGLIIKLNRTLSDVFYLENEVFVEAGTSLVALSDLSMKRSLSGLEWAAGIPATLGGAIFMNAGAYKVSMSDILSEVLVLKDDQFVWLTNQDCQFGYRTSLFQKNPEWVILGAKLSLQPAQQEEIKAVMDRRKHQRLSTQPLDSASCGSTFRNPQGYASWQLIDDCGLRGFGIGGAKVSSKHSNFLINTGLAKAEDMLKLIQLVQQSVKNKHNIDLQLEVEPFNWKDNE